MSYLTIEVMIDIVWSVFNIGILFSPVQKVAIVKLNVLALNVFIS